MIPCLKGDRSFKGDVSRTKQGAKQSASFKALVKLHALKALDDHLLPIREAKKSNAHDVDGNIIDRTPEKGLLETVFKNPCGNPRDVNSGLWFHRIAIGEGTNGYTVGLIAGASFEVFKEATFWDSPSETFVARLLSTERLDWTGAEREEQIEKLDDFNRKLTTVVLNQRIDKTEFFSYWTPLLPDGSIDWPLIDTAFLPADPAILNPESLIVILSRASSQHLFRYVEHRVELNTKDFTTTEVVGEAFSSGAKKLHAKYPLYAQYVRVKHDHGVIPGEPLLSSVFLHLLRRGNEEFTSNEIASNR